ncbi:MAG: NTP transferase domain-containing protein [Persicimonas sp.]
MSPSPQIRHAILLVAGLGSRLRPLTDDLPKCLIEVGGEPLLVKLLRQLGARGVEHAVLATGYREAQIRDCVADRDDLPQTTMRPNPAFAETNNAESLRLALPAVGSKPILLCDGDVLLRPGEWLDELLAETDRNVLAMITPESMGQEEMKIALADDGRRLEDRTVAALSKDLDPTRCAGESMGIQALSGTFVGPLSERLEAMSDEERASAYYEDIFADLMGPDHPFYARRVPTDAWTEIDTVEDLERARRLYRSWGQTTNR